MVLHMLGDARIVDQGVEPPVAGSGLRDPSAIGVLGHVALGD